MLVPVLVIGGIAFLLLREGEKTTTPDVDPTPTPEPTPEPTPTYDPTYTWSGEYAVSGPGGENVVWLFDNDGQTYIVIGNKTHTSFLSANSDRGTFTIPKEATGNETDSKRVIAFATLEDASAKADEMSNPAPRDPSDPVQPQPEDDEDDGSSGGGFGGLPAAPGYQLGQGMGSSPM